MAPAPLHVDTLMPEILHHPLCDLIGAAPMPCGCSDPDLPLLDAFKGAILASKTVKVAVR